MGIGTGVIEKMQVGHMAKWYRILGGVDRDDEMQCCIPFDLLCCPSWHHWSWQSAWSCDKIHLRHDRRVETIQNVLTHVQHLQLLTGISCKQCL